MPFKVKDFLSTEPVDNPVDGVRRGLVNTEHCDGFCWIDQILADLFQLEKQRDTEYY